MIILISVSSTEVSLLQQPIESALDLKSALPKNLWSEDGLTETVHYLANSIRRGKEELQQQGKLKTLGKDVLIELIRLDSIEGVNIRGDYRNDSKDLISYLKSSGKELPPIQIGVSKYGRSLLDGHHRLRAYQAIHKLPLAFIISVVDGKIGNPLVHLKIKL